MSKMLKVKALDSFDSQGIGIVSAGTVLDLSETKARDLEKRGLVKVVVKVVVKAAPKTKAVTAAPENKSKTK